MPSVSQRSSSTVVFGILSFQGMPQIFRRHLRWNWSSFFTCRKYQVQDLLPYKSMVNTTFLYTLIFLLRGIPGSDHSPWCNRPKLALALLIREVISSSMQAFCEKKAAQVAKCLHSLQLFITDLNDWIMRAAAYIVSAEASLGFLLC